MLLKAREDGVSKKKKLKTQSIRARLASIPSRSSGVGSFAMQIKGSASRRVEGQRVVGTVEDAGQGSVRAESVKVSYWHSFASPFYTQLRLTYSCIACHLKDFPTT